MARTTRARRIFAVSAAFLPIAAGLSACGSSSSSSSDTLVIAEWTNPASIAQTQKVDALFEQQHPGVKIRLQSAPTAANAWPTLQNSLLASRSVDVLAQFPPTPKAFPPASIGIKPTGTAALIASGQFLDLSTQPFMKRFDPVAQKYANGYNGGIYAVMTAEYVNSSGLFYKKDLLAKYGIAIPTTFGEFIADMQTLKSKGITPLYVAGKDNYQNNIWAGIINQLLMQDKPASEAASVFLQRAQDFWSGAQSWDSPLYQEAAKRYEQVMAFVEPSAGGVPAQTAPGNWAVKGDDFPFFVDGSFDGNTIATANPKLNFGFMSIPGTDTAAWNRPVLAPDLSWAVPVWSKHQQLALEWLDLFTQQSNYADYVKTTGSLSTEPTVPTPSLSWTDWLSSHVSQGYPNASQPWIPSSFPKIAGGPDLTKVQPIGPQPMADALKQSADAYRSAPRS
ncbi:ABC transporter substrate-binding protein [Streptacidiphilus sp. EB103A]|uniref:ABC transporter substrate-binding protein n=1 Tax=Streptacidiphilus sp. EB103A TaxID=3156275 RepID=UPI0035171A04